MPPFLIELQGRSVKFGGDESRNYDPLFGGSEIKSALPFDTAKLCKLNVLLFLVSTSSRPSAIMNKFIEVSKQVLNTSTLINSAKKIALCLNAEATHRQFKNLAFIHSNMLTQDSLDRYSLTD